MILAFAEIDLLALIACGLALLTWVVVKLDEKYMERANDDDYPSLPK